MTQIDISIEARKVALTSAGFSREAGLSFLEWLDAMKGDKDGADILQHLSEQELQACWNLSDESWTR